MGTKKKKDCYFYFFWKVEPKLEVAGNDLPTLNLASHFSLRLSQFQRMIQIPKCQQENLHQALCLSWLSMTSEQYILNVANNI